MRSLNIHDPVNPDNPHQFLVFIPGAGQYAVVIGRQHHGRYNTIEEAQAVRDRALSSPAPITPGAYGYIQRERATVTAPEREKR
jgi:hypothetical protein